ncbi:MAG: serine protease [Syntrophorhabdales bacterium]
MGKSRATKREAVHALNHFMKLMSALVRVECKKSGGQSSIGTGFIVGNGNFAVTAFHVVEDAVEVKVVRYHVLKGPEEANAVNYPREIVVDTWTKGAYLIGQKKDATEPLKTDGSILIEIPESGTEPLWKIDVSIMHLKETFSYIVPLEFDSEPARVGEDVLFIGYPGGGVEFKTEYQGFHPNPLLSKAIISFAVGYGVPPVVEYYYWLDRPSFPGLSGAPVLRVKTGKVIGVVSATPFMPKQIKAESGHFDVMIPDGYSVVFGTRMVREAVEHYIRADQRNAERSS